MKKIFVVLTLMCVLPTAVMAQVVKGVPPTGRLLASNCFQCHGTHGRAIGGMELLAGMSAREVNSELNEFKTKPKNSIMSIHAGAYTPAQITAIAQYFASVSAKGSN